MSEPVAERVSPAVLIVPGLWNSGPEHWQTHWERERADCRRVQQAEWDAPRCADWVATLDRAVRDADAPVVLAAHSLGCALVAHWACAASPDVVARVRGALLVAPSDVEMPGFPPAAEGFAPMPMRRLPFRATVVASSDDEWVTPARVREFAAAWGAALVDVGPRGHLGSASRLGRWEEGQTLLHALLE
jgi:hypothetical protein